MNVELGMVQMKKNQSFLGWANKVSFDFFSKSIEYTSVASKLQHPASISSVIEFRNS